MNCDNSLYTHIVSILGSYLIVGALWQGVYYRRWEQCFIQLIQAMGAIAIGVFILWWGK